MIRAELFSLLTITLFGMVVGYSGPGKPIRIPDMSPGTTPGVVYATHSPDCGEHKNGETFQTEDPCFQQTCSNGILLFKMCPPVTLKDSKCRRETGKGPYPHCCQHSVCPGDPGF
ncbi:uncharacterized protein [Parasteatoda tepidariorum]|uniref:uncharacterized protein n=1 Tax=Parasteatoda tepidariorum TaxID=114398 RepID=UPI00077FC288|nr:uncharacterized protein LOC107442301 [Parasteatoda tepidariorum]